MFNYRGHLLLAAAPALFHCWAGLLIPRAGAISSFLLPSRRGRHGSGGWQGWRSRDCRGWHSLNSVFLTSFLYLKFKMVRRKGVRMSLCTQLYPQDEIILTQCRQELWWASVWVVLMRCARFFSKKTSLPKSTG